MGAFTIHVHGHALTVEPDVHSARDNGEIVYRIRELSTTIYGPSGSGWRKAGRFYNLSGTREGFKTLSEAVAALAW